MDNVRHRLGRVARTQISVFCSVAHSDKYFIFIETMVYLIKQLRSIQNQQQANDRNAVIQTAVFLILDYHTLQRHSIALYALHGVISLFGLVFSPSGIATITHRPQRQD